jgi:hypothetical protein
MTALMSCQAKSGEQHDDDGADAAAQDAGRQGIARGQLAEVDRPGVGEQERGADEEGHAGAALDADDEDAGDAVACFHRAGRAQDVLDRTLRHADQGG